MASKFSFLRQEVEGELKIQAVSKYITLAQEGLVPRLECPMDQGLLMPNIDINDNIYLYCLSCAYKNIMGIEVYNNILKIVEAEKK